MLFIKVILFKNNLNSTSNKGRPQITRPTLPIWLHSTPVSHSEGEEGYFHSVICYTTLNVCFELYLAVEWTGEME